MSDYVPLPTQRRMATHSSSERCMFCKHWFDLSLSHGNCRRFPQEVLTAYMHFCGEFTEHDPQASNNPKYKAAIRARGQTT